MNSSRASLSQIFPSFTVKKNDKSVLYPNLSLLYPWQNLWRTHFKHLTEARFAIAFDFHFRKDWFVTLMPANAKNVKKTKPQIHRPAEHHSFSQASNLFFIRKDGESPLCSARVWQPPLHCQNDAYEYWIIGIIYLSLKIPFSSLITALSESLSSYYGCFWQHVCVPADGAWQGLAWWSDCWLTVLCGELIESGWMMNVLFEDAQGQRETHLYEVGWRDGWKARWGRGASEM